MSLNSPLTRERHHELQRAALAAQHLDSGGTPVTRVTLRYASAADRERLRRLAELDSSPELSGPLLVAEVDDRLRATLPLDGGLPIADPFHRGAELIELLRMRARQ